MPFIALLTLTESITATPIIIIQAISVPTEAIDISLLTQRFLSPVTVRYLKLDAFI